MNDNESFAINSAAPINVDCDCNVDAAKPCDIPNVGGNQNDIIITDDIEDYATTDGISVNPISSPAVTVDEFLVEQSNDETDIDSFATSAAISFSESRGHSISQIEEDSKLKKKRDELKKQLLGNDKITLSLGDNENSPTISLPIGKLAGSSRPSSFIPQNGTERKSSDGIDNCTYQFPMSTQAPHSPYIDTSCNTSRNGIIKRIFSHLNFTRKSHKKEDNVRNNTSIRTQCISTQTINSCVYAPAEVVRDDYMLVQVYLYRDEESDKVRAKATTIDKSAEIRQYKPLELPIKVGDEVRIHLKMKGTEIETDTKSFLWTGSFKSCEFSVFIPENYSSSTLHGTFDVFINNMPAGEMIFKTMVVDTEPSKLSTNIKARVFEKIFVSYSHKDASIVRPLVEGLRIANKDYFFDRHTLKGGDKYREEILKWIDTSDVFVLCWSKNAAESIEVTKEKNYALEVISKKGSSLRLYPLSISPAAPLPSDMNDTYNFAQLNP